VGLGPNSRWLFVLSLHASDLHDAIQSGSVERVKAEVAPGRRRQRARRHGATPSMTRLERAIARSRFY